MATEMAWNQLATDLGCITSPHTVANIMGLKNRQVFLPHSVCVWCVCVCVCPSVRPSSLYLSLLTLRWTNPVGRHYSLSGGAPWYTTHLVASNRSGQKENCSKDGHAGPPSWIGRVISPSGTESCYISSSSAPWWITRATRGGLRTHARRLQVLQSKFLRLATGAPGT